MQTKRLPAVRVRKRDLAENQKIETRTTTKRKSAFEAELAIMFQVSVHHSQIYTLDIKHKSVTQGKHNLQTVESLQPLHENAFVNDVGQ